MCGEKVFSIVGVWLSDIFLFFGADFVLRCA